MPPPPRPEELLLPAPRRLEHRPGVADLGAGIRCRPRCDEAGVAVALERVLAALSRSGVERRESGLPLRLRRTATAPTSAIEAQSYVLEVRPDGIRIDAPGEIGLSYGLATLEQWVRLRASDALPAPALPCVTVEDAPAVAERGVLLDISRSRVPTMERLFALVDRLSGWKINQLQLYTEHTFAYRGHETVWRDASPVTPEEARRLDAHCRERHVELIPNQNSFGHLHRWLRHAAYRHLAECPEGIEHPFSREREPFSLCPLDPGSLALLDDLYAQLLPNFSSRRLHIGFDETIDLGRGRSRARAEEIGVAGLYRDFLRDVHGLAARHGRRIQFWGDIVARQPGILSEVPRDAVVMEWGYEADHPFAERAASLADANLEFHLCPGTSSWLSLAGRWTNARTNISRAVRTAVDAGAAGVTVTDWGDQGHLQPPVASEPGLLAAATLAWNPAVPLGTDAAADLLDAHVVSPGAEAGPAAALLELADLYRLPGGGTFNGSPLFYLLTRPELPLEHPRLAGLSADGLAECVEVAEGAAVPGDGLSAREIRWVRDALALGARLGTERLSRGASESAAELPAAVRRDLAARLAELIEEHRALWRRSSRPGGLDESTEALARAHRVLVGRDAAPTDPG